MNSLLTRRSGTFTLQVLLSGRVQDALSGGAPKGGLVVRLIDPVTKDDYPLYGRVRSDGTFAFFGVPETAFPLIAHQSYHLQLEASAPNYQSKTLEIEVKQMADQPQPVTYSIPPQNIEPIQVYLFTDKNPQGLPQVDLSLKLERLPVRLHGRVVEAGKPMTGLANATLQLNTPSGSSTIKTDAQGNFKFPDPLPLVLSVDIKVSAPDFNNATLAYDLDYTQPVNSLLIELKKSS